jgi:hypothetical protein
MRSGSPRELGTLRIDRDNADLLRITLEMMMIEVTAADLAQETVGETSPRSVGTTRTLVTSTQIPLRRFIFRSWTGELGSRILRTASERLDEFEL